MTTPPPPNTETAESKRFSAASWRVLGAVAALTLLVLSAVLMGTPFQSAAGADTDPAPASCDTADAVSKARAAFDWHSEHGSDAPLFWRILNTLDADNVPAKPSSVTDDTVSAADVETFSSGKGWGGWSTIVDALKCVEKAAADSDDGADTDDGSSTDSDGTDTSDETAAIDPAPASCDTADAISKARAAFDWHSKHGSDAPLFWRILNTLDADNLPAKPSDVTDDTISASDVETFSSGKGWGGWSTIVDALKCVEKAAAANDGSDSTDDGTDTTDQDSQGTQDSQQSTTESQQQQVIAPLSQQDQQNNCTDWDASDLTVGEGDNVRFISLATPAGCEGFSDVAFSVEIVASHNGTKPLREGCTDDEYNFADEIGRLGIHIHTKTGVLTVSPCDDNTIVERQVTIRDTNASGGAKTKTITITDDDSANLMAPSWVFVQRQSAAQNLPSDVDDGYDSTKTYAAGEKVFDGLFTWTRNDKPLKAGGPQPAAGSESNPNGGPDTRGCRSSSTATDSRYCWESSFVRYDSNGVSVQTGRGFFAPYRLVILQTGAAHPMAGTNSFSFDGSALVVNVPANVNGYTAAGAWFDQQVVCAHEGPGWVQVHVYKQGGPKFGTAASYRDGGNKIQICW